MVIGVCAGVAVVVIGGFTGHVRVAKADDVDCAQVKCIALTFDDGPSPYTGRLLQILKDNDAKATFFEIGNKVAANPEGAKSVVDAGMELGNHTWEHPNMTAIPPEDIPAQFSKASDAIEAATGQRPKLVRTAGGLRLFDMKVDGEDSEAWLRLFVAAPEMLATLYAIEAWIVALGFGRFTELDQIRRVIRMATGAPRS